MEYLKKLFDYNLWANKRVENSLLSQTSVIDQKISSLVSHLAQTQIIWMNRILDIQPQTHPWPDYPLNTAFSLLLEGSNEWIDFINKNDFKKLSELCTYTNTEGKTFTNTIIDIVLHLLNHNSYHRGQIASFVKQKGGKPPVTDYIVYIRE